jgi:hypothetical protein
MWKMSHGRSIESKIALRMLVAVRVAREGVSCRAEVESNVLNCRSTVLGWGISAGPHTVGSTLLLFARWLNEPT